MREESNRKSLIFYFFTFLFIFFSFISIFVSFITQEILVRYSHMYGFT